MSGLGLPDLEHDVPSRKVDVHVDFIAAGVERRMDRQVLEVGRRIVRHLVAVGIDGLGEVSLTVEHADRDERDVEIARRLAMVAGENAETARVDLKAFMQAELGAEIRDQVLVRIEILGDGRFGALLMIGVVTREDAVVVLHEHAILGRVVQPFLRDAPQEDLRIVAAGFP